MATKPAVKKTPVPKPEDTQPAPNGVLVIKTVDPETGNIRVNAEPLGDVLATEVQTLLELSVGAWRQRIGLSG